MAKKYKKEKDDAKQKFSTSFIVIIIVLIWLAIFALLIKLDIGGFGSILRPLIKDVPIVNIILPSVSEEQIAYENNYPYQSITDAVNQLNELEQSNSSLSEENESYKQKIQELEAEIANLKELENNQLVFEERVKEFETNVVFGDVAPGIEEYKKYYEEINPTNAEDIYRQVIEQTQVSDSIKEKADIYKNMDPDAAAKIFETMTADIDLVAQMLLSMKSSESSAILQEMDSTAAAKITKKMFDMDKASNN